MPYVNQRWLGGMLTNFKTIRKRVDRLHQLEDGRGRTFDLCPRSNKPARKRKSLKVFGRHKEFNSFPEPLWLNSRKERIAVRSEKMGYFGGE